jgi:hypothetical protein
MRHARYRVSTPSLSLLAMTLSSAALQAQGCEPIRFTTPVNLGGQGEAYQRAKQWRVTAAYRRLLSNEWVVGSTVDNSRAPGGQSPVFSIHTFLADVAYAPSDRVTLHLAVPVSFGSLSRNINGQVREQVARGLGDASVLADIWMRSPRTHADGNVAIGIGIKAPTGNHRIGSQFWTATSTVDFPADQTIQPSDGGWAILTQAQAFRRVASRLHVYAFGSYMISPKAQSDVVFSPGSTLHWSVPDVYSARVGGSVAVLEDQGLSASLGARLDGIPLRDLIGGGDDNTVKRTSRVVFLDPGVTLSRGNDTFTVTVPWRVHVNRTKSLYETQTNGVNGGGFAKYLVFASYSRRI